MSETDPAPPQNCGTIVVVGGGCYGSYYVRQLERAARAGAIVAHELVVIDHDPECAVARTLQRGAETAIRTSVVVAEWRDYFDAYLADASNEPLSAESDAIVPSPLMPHLMGAWLVDRARDRWPDRNIATKPFDRAPTVPWDRSGDDGTHYVSFAT